MSGLPIAYSLTVSQSRDSARTARRVPDLTRVGRVKWGAMKRLLAGRKRLLTAVRLVRRKGLGRPTDDDVQSAGGAHKDDVELEDDVGDSNADSDGRAGEDGVELKDVGDSDGAGALQSDGSAGKDHGVDDKGARDDADVGGGLPAANKLVPKWRQMELDQLAQNTEWKNDGTALSTRGPSRCSACGRPQSHNVYQA